MILGVLDRHSVKLLCHNACNGSLFRNRSSVGCEPLLVLSFLLPSGGSLRIVVEFGSTLPEIVVVTGHIPEE